MLYVAHSTWYNLIMAIINRLSEAIEQARVNGVSRYKICKDLDINQGTLHRIMHGTGGCSIRNLEKLCDYLSLELKPKDKKEGK